MISFGSSEMALEEADDPDSLEIKSVSSDL